MKNTCKKKKTHTNAETDFDESLSITLTIADFLETHMENTYNSSDNYSDDSATDVQIGGNHYKDMAIQPIDYIMKNNLGYCEANVVKYISRWKSKNGVEDLRKARHYIDLLIESQLTFNS